MSPFDILQASRLRTRLDLRLSFDDLASQFYPAHPAALTPRFAAVAKEGISLLI